MERKKISERACVGSYVVSLFFMWIGWWLLYSIDSNKYNIIKTCLSNNNLITYAFFILMFLFMFVVIYFIIMRLLMHIEIRVPRLLITTGTMLLVIAFAYWFFVGASREVGYTNSSVYDFPIFFRIGLYLMLLICVLFAYNSNDDIPSWLLIMIYAISIFISMISVLVINPFTCGVGGFSIGMNNVTSVTETIYNVLDLVPFDKDTSSLYGHYSLLLAAPVALLGGGTKAIALTIGMCGALCQLFTIYVINVFAPKRWIAALVAMASVVRTTYTYPAIFPIRTLWPILSFAYFVFIYKNHKKQNFVILFLGYALSSLAMVWNLETGIACLLGTSAFFLIDLLITDSEVSVKNGLMAFLRLFFFSTISAFFSVVLVNIYNLSCGMKRIIIKDFFFPFNTSWGIDELRCNMPIGIHGNVYVLSFLLGVLTIVIFLCFNKKSTRSRLAPLMAGAATIGVVTFTYYVNEAHWGCMDIVRQISFALVAIIMSVSWNKNEDVFLNSIKSAFIVFSLFVATMYAFEAVYDPIRISDRNRAGLYDMARLNSELEQFRMSIPENTYGLGQGINIIYHELGWDNHAKMRDTSALYISNENGYNNLIDEVLVQNEFVIAFYDSYDVELLQMILQKDDSYNFASSVYIFDKEYRYYKK